MAIGGEKPFMPKSSRRGFLGLLAAAPIAARQGAQSAAAGLSVSGPAPRMSQGYGEPCPDRGSWWTCGLDVAKRQLLPWRRRQLEREAGVVESLDPDIASMRSMSLVGKVHMQRGRQLVRAEADVWELVWRQQERDKE